LGGAGSGRQRPVLERDYKHIEVVKKQAAQRQIDAAIEHIYKSEFECAVTLAAAAEASLPDTKNDHGWAYLKRHPTFKEVDYNETINWLKHDIQPDTRVIFEYETAVIIFRAQSKYVAVYREAPEKWGAFL
jgi:hypothetical protein